MILIKNLRILPATWAKTRCSLGNRTRKKPLGSTSVTFPLTSIASVSWLGRGPANRGGPERFCGGRSVLILSFLWDCGVIQQGPMGRKHQPSPQKHAAGPFRRGGVACHDAA